MKIELKKIKSNHSNVRTDVIIGQSEGIPTINERFNMTAEPLTDGAFIRVVTTSPVLKLITLRNGDILFHTRNSIYEFKQLENV